MPTITSFLEAASDVELLSYFNSPVVVVLNLYKLTQSVCTGFDVFDSCVVAARSETEARLIYPGAGGFDKITDSFSSWPGLDKLLEINVELIGTAIRGVKAGRICTSFRAE